MTLAIPAYGDLIIVSIEYAPNGLDWCRIFDNHALGWLVDETTPIPPSKSTRKPSEPPPETTGAHVPFPIILGSMPVPAPDTSPILSPQWAKFKDPAILVPDMLRAALPDFLTWLACNNGAQRPIISQIALHSALFNGYNDWAAANPSLTMAAAVPANTSVPYAWQEGDTLNSTMGNWTAEPTSYAYQWQRDGTPVGAGGATYPVGAADVGKSMTCVVTATNPNGSTRAPPSNAVIAAAP
jgi:hypothetical protein